MKEYRGKNVIFVSITSNARAVGKTTIAMKIIKFLRLAGVRVEYSGYNENHERLVLKQVERDDIGKLDKNLLIVVVDSN